MCKGCYWADIQHLGQTTTYNRRDQELACVREDRPLDVTEQDDQTMRRNDDTNI